jgi:hypothetical protein
VKIQASIAEDRIKRWGGSSESTENDVEKKAEA